MKLNSGLLPLVIFFVSNANCIPRPLEDHLEAEGRFHKKKHKLGYGGGGNPCGTGIFGRNQAEPRTFVDWNIQLITNNYNTLCGGGGGPIRPPGGGHFQHLGSHGNGLFGLGLLDLFFGMSGNVQNPRPNPVDNNQYDPVNPDINVASTAYNNNYRPRPRPYLNVYQNAQQNAYQNPFGGYGQDILNFNPNKILKQANRQLHKLAKPFYDLF